MEQPNLHNIFPAIDHLKQYLDDADMGAISLSSKTLYKTCILNFKQLQTDIYILKHYIHHKSYKNNVNIDFLAHGQKLSVPIPLFIVALKKLRMLIGQEEFFKSYNYIFFKKDLIYNKNHHIVQDFCACPFCEKFIESDKHVECWGVAREWNPIRKNMINYVHPELEYYVMHNEQTMPIKMEYYCSGRFRPTLLSFITDNITKSSKCDLCCFPNIFHQVPYKKINY